MSQPIDFLQLEVIPTQCTQARYLSHLEDAIIVNLEKKIIFD